MEEVKQEQEIAVVEQQTEALAPSVMIMTPQIYKMLTNQATILSKSQIVPARYRGDPNTCFTACEIAWRMGLSPFMVMQNLDVIQGSPSWGGKACISLINGTRLFTPLDFIYVGTKGQPDYGCFVQTKRRYDGKVVTGSIVDMAMAKAAGWLDKKGSSWLIMPDQMLMYRAAAFFARVHCPHALMGLQTTEEVQDVKGYEDPANEKIMIRMG